MENTEIQTFKPVTEKTKQNKVLLRKRKRHTAHRGASTRSAALFPGRGVAPSSPDRGGVTPIQSQQGGCPGVSPILTWDLTWQLLCQDWIEVSPNQDWMRVPPPILYRVPHPPGRDLGPVKVLWDGGGVPPGKDMGLVEVLWDRDIMGWRWGYPPGVNR